jgi:hypothetical protein
MNRTVIVACSARKRETTAELSALARYDGPAWRTLRANLSCVIEPPLALSAEYGLISAYQEIPDYNRKLDAVRVTELIPIVADQFVALLDQGRLRGATFVYGGELYRELMQNAVELVDSWLPRRRGVELIYSHGGIGEQLGQLKDFLTKPGAPVPAIAADDEGDE